MARLKKGSRQAKLFMARIRNKRKVNKARTSNKTMARKRSRRSRAMSFGRKYRRSSKGSSSFNVMNLLIGEAGFLLYRGFLAPSVQNIVGANLLPVVETVGGLLLHKSKIKYVKDFGTVAFVIGSYSLMVQYLSPMLGGLGGASTQTASSSMYY
jgi:hypothetical protein